MNADAVQQFKDLLTQRFGWHLESDRGQLAQVLAARADRYESAEAYLASLAQASAASSEVRMLAETFAVSETYFFRNPEQFVVLGEVALPAIARRRTGGPIRILSAGSASGEEAYSIAITVLKLQQRQQLPAVEILGVDLSRRAIDKAIRGRYTGWALRGLPATIRTEFFRQDGQHFQIGPAVAAMVRFREANLLDLHAAAPGRWDIVFFRNTFMYFTRDTACTVFDQLSGMMAPDAFVFLGHAETLRGISDDYALRQSHETFYYQREPVDRARHTEPLPWIAAGLPPAQTDAPPLDDSWFHAIVRATERVAELVDGPRDRPATEAFRTARRARSASRGNALTLLAEERYQEALDALGPGHEADDLLLRGVLLVNLDRLDEARRTCVAMLAADSFHAGAHFVLALCEERAGNDTLAARHDEMAIYLDDTFAMPHLHLATLAHRSHDRVTAFRHTARARDLLGGEDDVRIRLFGGGFSRQALLQLCEGQLRALAS
jgi:chemotaxis protein methyltransferase CheR